MLKVTPWENDQEQDFLEIYEKWPRKEKFLEAQLAWLKMRPTHENTLMILAQLAQNTTGNGIWVEERFCPRLAKYLHEKRWLDGIKEKDGTSKTSVKPVTPEEIVAQKKKQADNLALIQNQLKGSV